MEPLDQFFYPSEVLTLSEINFSLDIFNQQKKAQTVFLGHARHRYSSDSSCNKMGKSRKIGIIHPRGFLGLVIAIQCMVVPDWHLGPALVQDPACPMDTISHPKQRVANTAQCAGAPPAWVPQPSQDPTGTAHPGLPQPGSGSRCVPWPLAAGATAWLQPALLCSLRCHRWSLVQPKWVVPPVWDCE